MKKRGKNIEIFSVSAIDVFASALGSFILIAIILLPNYKVNQEYLLRAETAETENIKLDKEIEEKKSEIEKKDEEIEKNIAEIKSKEEEIKTKDDEITAKNDELENKNSELEELGGKVAALEDEVSEFDEIRQNDLVRIQQLEDELSVNVLIVVVEWEERGADVDLFVTDNLGNLYNYSNKNQNGSNYENIPAQLSIDNLFGPGIEVWQHTAAGPGTYEVEVKLHKPTTGRDQVPITLSVFSRGGRQIIDVPALVPQGQTINVTIVVDEDGTVIVET